jgi:SAM-dependent methyltransferase
MYALHDYLWMLADERRVAAYLGALTAQVRPGDRVIEIGAGFGFFAMMAARAGAAHVDAVETNPIGHIGKRIAAANGHDSQVRFHIGDALTFEPEHRADVVIADLRGPLPFAGQSLKVMIDARRRLLRDGGILIARADRLWCAPVSRADAFERQVGGPLDQLGLDLEPLRRVLVDTPMRCAIATGELCAAPASWGLIDYLAIDRPSFSGSCEWRFDAPASVRGLAAWFEADLGAGYTFSTSPDADRSVYSQLYLPLRDTVTLGRGDTLQVQLASHLAGEDYVWAWTTRVVADDGTPRLVVSQNSIAGQVIDLAIPRDRSS